ncbi:MAG: hypothetical protein ACWGOL_04910 [Desulfuromonadales bacterium]
MRYHLAVPLLSVIMLALSASVCPAQAADDNRLLCAITEVVECDSLGECAKLEAEEVGLPDFLIVDLASKKIKEATTVSLRESSFAAHSPVEGITILSGVDGMRGWSAVLSSENTRVTASVSDEEAGFIVFGHCRVEP